MKVVVVGGGIIGLCSAYYAQKSGHEVTVIDNQPEGASSTSTGNAGMIVPSHFVPLAAPGMIQMGLKMLLNPKSPFGFKFPPTLDQLLWTLSFAKAATKQHVANTETILRDLNYGSRKEYESLTEEIGVGIELRKDGLLMLCQTSETLAHEGEMAKRANEIGLKAEVLNREQLGSLDPDTRYDVAGAVHFLDDASLTPTNLLAKLRETLAANGAKLLFGEQLTSVQYRGSKVSKVTTGSGEFECDELVVATGAWSGYVAKLFGRKLPMLAGRGYGFTVPNPPSMPKVCAILTEARVAMTPMADGLRFTGTMELGPPSDAINQNRLAGIREGVRRFLPEFQAADLESLSIWQGNRPCSPDGLPYIGRISENVTVATGHGMMGLSLGPITGKLVAELISGQPTSLPLQQLDPNRYA